MKRLLPILLAAAMLLGISMIACAAGEDTGFTDVDANAWYAEAVAYCREHGLMNGTSNTTFEPEGNLTRAMLVTVLYRMSGSPAVSGDDGFTDTAAGAWYSDAVLWAAQQGVVNGYGNGMFGANDPVTREQMAAILWRYAGSPPATGTAGFSDEADVSGYAAAAVNWAGMNNIVATVSEGVFAPKSNATRAQVAVALTNYDRSKQSESADGKVLVAWFSRYGNTDYDSGVDATSSASVVVRDGERQGTTELIARLIADATGGELHLIKTAESYPVDFDDVVSRNHQEISDGARPELSSQIDVSGYDVIFIGYPVWATTAPTPVLSFLESCDLSGKTVIPFCTHDGYGAGSSYSAVEKSSSGAAVERGLAVESSDAASAESAVKSWLNGLNLAKSGGEGQAALRITVGEVTLDGVLYDSDMARQFAAQLPQTVSMSNYGGREVYGGIDRAIRTEGSGQLSFENGDITYCPSNNTAAIFYAQTDRPDLTMEIYPIGKVTSDLTVFPELPGRVEITFEVVS